MCANMNHLAFPLVLILLGLVLLSQTLPMQPL